jgi:PAS domain S-box-containing protein
MNQRVIADMEGSLAPFFALSLDLLCIRNQDGYFEALNSVWSDTLGWSLEELRSLHWLSLVHPADVAASLDAEYLGWQSQQAEPVQYEARYRCQDGTYRWLSWRWLQAEDGRLYGMAQDVTQRSWSGNQSYRTGIEETIRLRDNAIAASSVGMVIADARLPDMPLIFVNPAFERMTGYSASEVLGTNCRFLQGDDGQQEELDRLRAAIRAGTDCTVVLRNYRKDGNLFWNELHISPIYDPKRRLTHFVGIQSDITARKQAEAALKLERTKSETLLLNILPKAIAERLKEYQIGLTKRDGEPFIAEGFEAVTILFADIVGFTQIAQSTPPTTLVGLLNRIFSVFDRLCEERGLEKIKTIGDEYMVVGGVPNPRADHADAIADMALAMQQAIAQFTAPNGQPIQIRIGIHSGSVIAGVIGTRKFSYDLWGDAVNVASRMESHSVPGRIQVSADAYEFLKDLYHFEERGVIPLKGRGQLMTYWLLNHAAPKDNQLPHS